MSRLNRLMLTAVALGVAACGDDVTVQPPAPPPVTVVVTPDGATIVIGATLQMNAAVSGGDGTAATIAWSSSNNATATVSNTGLVTGVAAGSVGITATATVGTSSGAGSATVTVESDQPELPPTVSIANITGTVCGPGGNCVDLPVNLAAVAGQINVSINLERNNNPVTKVALFLNDEEVASQEFGASAPAQSGAAAVPEVIVLQVNTAEFDPATGLGRFPNGPTTLSAAVEVEGGEGPAAGNSRNLTLANQSGIVFVSVTNENNNELGEIELPNSAVNPTTGLAWTAGNHVLNVIGVSYVAGARIASFAGSFLGIGFNVPLTEGAVTAIDFNNGGTGPRQIAGYQSPVAGESPTVASSVFSNGTTGPTTVLNSASTPIPDVPALPLVRVDNADPGTAPTFDPAFIWVTTDTDFQDMILTAGVDAGVNDVETAFFAGTAPLTTTGCTLTGLTLVDAGGDLAASTTSTAHGLRAVTYDALGNALCVDPGTVGADFVAPTGTIAGPADGAGFNAPGAAPAWAFTGSDNASGFGATPVSGIMTRLNADGTTSCVLGSGTGCTVPGSAALTFDAFNSAIIDGYYTFASIALEDQAGNPLAFPNRMYLLDQVPAGIAGGITLQALYNGNATATFTTAPNAATDNLDLNNVFGTLTYAPGVLQFPPQSLGTFGPPLEKSATITLSIPDFIRCLNAAGDYATTTNKPTSVGLNVSDFAQTSPSSLSFAIPAVNVADCNGAGNIPAADILSFGMLAPDYGTGKVNVDVDGAAVGTTSSTTVTLKAEAEVAINTSVDPFTRVDFYFLNPAGNWEKFGTATGVLRQTSAPARFYTYTLSPAWDPPAGLLPNATVVVIGVDAQGDAVFSTSVAIVAVP